MRLGLFDRVRRFARLPARLRGRSGRPAGPLGPTGPAGYTSHVGPGHPGGPASAGDQSSASGLPSASGIPSSGGAPSPAGTSVASGLPAASIQGSTAEDPWPKATGTGRHRRDGEPSGSAGAVGAVRSGSARARVRVREAPDQEQPDPGHPETGQTGRALAGRAAVRSVGATARAAVARARTSAEARPAPVRAAVPPSRVPTRARLPYTAPQVRERPATADGRRHCGSLERVIWRQWDEAIAPPAQVVAAIDRLAELPERIKTRLADGLDAIFVGPGGVPELDDMTSLRGVRLPSGHASWDVCAGAYGERKIVVGSRPSPTPDVMCHEIGHALDDIDSPPGTWQSDSAQFRMLYDQCQPHFASDFHRQPGGLGRKEFFADAFAAIASGQRPALVDMLRGETRTALRVMLYFNRRYDI
jgi:hypothetical protein